MNTSVNPTCSCPWRPDEQVAARVAGHKCIRCGLTFAAPAGQNSGTLQYCTITKANADGSGYVANRIFIWAGCTSGWVELVDTVTKKVSYEDNATFARRFTRLSGVVG